MSWDVKKLFHSDFVCLYKITPRASDPRDDLIDTPRPRWITITETPPTTSVSVNTRPKQKTKQSKLWSTSFCIKAVIFPSRFFHSSLVVDFMIFLFFCTYSVCLKKASDRHFCYLYHAFFRTIEQHTTKKVNIQQIYERSQEGGRHRH